MSSAAREPDRGTLDLDRFVPYRLSVLTNRVSNAIAREYSERFGLSIPEWRVMAVLGGMPDLSASDVAARTEMDKVQVSRAVASLLRTRRVQRQTDRSDARITRLSLTAKGRAIYDEIVPLALLLERQFLNSLNEEERASFDRLLSKLAEQALLLPLTAIPGERAPRRGSRQMISG
jgi:DNA-binding MarR family transcriptional regulator